MYSVYFSYLPLFVEREPRVDLSRHPALDNLQDFRTKRDKKFVHGNLNLRTFCQRICEEKCKFIANLLIFLWELE